MIHEAIAKVIDGRVEAVNAQTIDIRLPTTKEQRQKANESAKKVNTHVPVLADFEVVFALPEINDKVRVLVSSGSPMAAYDAAFSEIRKKLKPEIAYDRKKVVWESTKKI